MIDKSEGAGNRSLMIKAVMMGSKISFFLIMVLYIPFLIEMPFILKMWLINVPEYTIVFCSLLLIRNLIEQLFIPVVSAISAEQISKSQDRDAAQVMQRIPGVTLIQERFGVQNTESAIARILGALQGPANLTELKEVKPLRDVENNNNQTDEVNEEENNNSMTVIPKVVLCENLMNIFEMEDETKAEEVPDILKEVEDISFIYLTAEDVVRNRLVGEIVTAYGNWDENISKSTFPIRSGKGDR